MNKFKWIPLIIIVGSFVGCYGDAAVSNLLFKKYCDEDGRTGQFIYERVPLAEEYFKPIPFTKEGVALHFDRGFLIGQDKLLIDKGRLIQDFNISAQKQTTLSRIGPIYSYEYTIVRKSDGKILSKSVSLLNKKGWLSRQSILGMTVGDTCQKYKNPKGLYSSKSAHTGLIKNTFYKD
jgi:hypothetical protein